VVKTADDRATVIWSEKVDDPGVGVEELERILASCLKHHGRPFQSVYRSLVPQDSVACDEQAISDAKVHWTG
jgi:hypothetical protein